MSLLEEKGVYKGKNTKQAYRQCWVLKAPINTAFKLTENVIGLLWRRDVIDDCPAVVGVATFESKRRFIDTLEQIFATNISVAHKIKDFSVLGFIDRLVAPRKYFNHKSSLALGDHFLTGLINIDALIINRYVIGFVMFW